MKANVIQIHRDLVSIPSLSHQEKEAADYLENLFSEANVNVTRMGDNIIAQLGQGENGMLLNSHLDVVPPSSDHPFPPFEPTEKELLEVRTMLGKTARCMEGGPLMQKPVWLQ